MTGRVDVERILDAFLAPAADQLSEYVIEASLSEIARIPQRRALRGPWRFPMPTFARVAGLGLAALLLSIAGALILGGGGRRPLVSPPVTTFVPTPGSTATTAPTGPGLFAPMGYTGGGTIEFTKHDASGADELWIVDPSGANPTRLVQGGCCGLFSPDGRQLALAAPGIVPAALTPDTSRMGIEVLDASGRVAFTVPTGCGACEIAGLNSEPDAWSPDGRYIALSMWSDSDPTKAGMGLADRDFTLPWDWAQTRATGQNLDIPVGFSPDSTQLLFMRTEREDGPTSVGSLYVLQVGDLAVRQLAPGLNVLTNGLIQAPASWTPDGHEIAYAARDPKTDAASIFITAAVAGAKPTVVVAGAPGAASARLSPDGSLIAFDEASSSGAHDVYVVHPDGTGLTNLTKQFAPGACCGQWSPDGRALVVTATPSDDSHYDLYVVAVDGSGIWQVTNEPNVYTGFLWGPGFR